MLAENFFDTSDLRFSCSDGRFPNSPCVVASLGSIDGAGSLEVADGLERRVVPLWLGSLGPPAEENHRKRSGRRW